MNRRPDAKLLRLEARRARLIARAKMLSREEDRIFAQIKGRLGSCTNPRFEASNPLVSVLRDLKSYDCTIPRPAVDGYNKDAIAGMAGWRTLPQHSPSAAN